MRVAVTGAGGRLGRALVAALEDASFVGPRGPIAWGRSEFDLDHVEAVDALVDRDRPEVVVHAAAWTDVDACAREPALAIARNGRATEVLARVCAQRAVDLVVISTNEVFDGRRTDGRGYAPTDTPVPANPYGASKLAGESGARAAYEESGRRRGQLAIVRTAWLFGPGKPDFPAKILAAAAEVLTGGGTLRLVADEWGSPTYAVDLAEAIVELLGTGDFEGIHHVVNAGATSRAGWARELLRQARIDVPIEDVGALDWARASTPPAWGVLESTAQRFGEGLRPWQEALADYLPALLKTIRMRPRARVPANDVTRGNPLAGGTR